MYITRIIKNNLIINVDKSWPTNWKIVQCKDCKVIKLCKHPECRIMIPNTMKDILYPCIYFNLDIT